MRCANWAVVLAAIAGGILVPARAQAAPTMFAKIALAHNTITVHSLPNAYCAAFVLFDTDQRLQEIGGILAVGKSGAVRWSWRPSKVGTLTATCLLNNLLSVDELRVEAAAPAHLVVVPTQPPPTTRIPVPPSPTATGTPVPVQTTFPPLPTAMPAANATSANAPGVIVTATNLHVDGPGIDPPDMGQKYVVVRVTILNNGRTPYDYNGIYFTLQDAGDGFVHQGYALDTNVAATQLNYGTIVPGQSVSGDLVFEVPSSETSFLLQWEPVPLGPTVHVPIA